MVKTKQDNIVSHCTIYNDELNHYGIKFRLHCRMIKKSGKEQNNSETFTI